MTHRRVYACTRVLVYISRTSSGHRPYRSGSGKQMYKTCSKLGTLVLGDPPKISPQTHQPKFGTSFVHLFSGPRPVRMMSGRCTRVTVGLVYKRTCVHAYMSGTLPQARPMNCAPTGSKSAKSTNALVLFRDHRANEAAPSQASSPTYLRFSDVNQVEKCRLADLGKRK